MTTLLLARHGETEWNRNEIFRGRIDVELNETGLNQAALLAEHLRNVEIEAVYSSPLKRATATAQAIAGFHGLGVQAVPGLTDMDFGKWHGLPLAEARAQYPALYSEWLTHSEKVRPPDGETLAEVRERALRVVDDIVKTYRGVVVLGSHRVVLKVLICALLGLDDSHFWSIRLDNCGITRFSFSEGRWVLDEHNNTSFLKALDSRVPRDF